MVSSLYQFNFGNPNNCNNLKPFRKAHLSKVSKLTCGLFEGNQSLEKSLTLVTFFPKIQCDFLKHIHFIPPSIAPLTLEQKAALKAKRHSLKEECTKIQAIILDHLFTKPREMSRSQYKTLKHLHDEWLNCRFW